MSTSKSSLDPLAVGIDIGGTGTKFGIVDRVGNVLFSGEISTKKHAQAETLTLKVLVLPEPSSLFPFQNFFDDERIK